jgi:hypothetical protein
MLTYQLSRPFGYILIRHPVKKVVDWYIPSGLAIFLAITLCPLRTELNVWGTGGMVQMAQQVVQGLPGFYIAALAAVATFGQQSTLDMEIPAPTPTIQTRSAGEWISMKLTRRRFLCLLFAYLTSVSILLSLLATYGMAVAAPIRKLTSSWFAEVISYAGTTVYSVFLFQLVVVTLWGLYYLSDRMLQPE